MTQIKKGDIFTIYNQIVKVLAVDESKNNVTVMNRGFVNHICIDYLLANGRLHK